MARNGSKRAGNSGSVFKRKDGRWVAQVLLGYDGTTGRPKYKTVYAKSQAEAVKELNKTMAAVTTGKTVPTERTTLGQFLDRWLDGTVRGHKEPKTVDYYVMMVDRHIKPALGRIDLRKLTAEQIQLFLNEKGKPRKVGDKTVTLSPASVAGIRRVFRAAMNQAWKWGLVAENVVVKTVPPKVKKSDPVYLHPDQALKLAEAAKGHPIENLLLVALGTGMRIGEATGLRWQDVDTVNPKQATLRVGVQLQRVEGKLVHKSVKSASSRRSLPLLGYALEGIEAEKFRQARLQAELGDSFQNPLGLVFLNSEGRPLDPKYVHNHLKALCRKAGIPEVSFHKLRHTAATHMVAEGVPLALVKDQLGHSSIALTTGTYAHMVPVAQRKAAEKLDAVFRKAQAEQ
ncbi:MAG: site-specific integrase [Armatimonadetes bacterium]|nr:site-specific integrase [Armatimonadota bacterium]